MTLEEFKAFLEPSLLNLDYTNINVVWSDPKLVVIANKIDDAQNEYGSDIHNTQLNEQTLTTVINDFKSFKD